jgi:hypothetical protein
VPEIESFEDVFDSVECTAAREDVEDESRDAVRVRDMGQSVLGQTPLQDAHDPQLVESIDDQGEMFNEQAAGGRGRIHPHKSPIEPQTATGTENRAAWSQTPETGVVEPGAICCRCCTAPVSSPRLPTTTASNGVGGGAMFI